MVNILVMLYNSLPISFLCYNYKKICHAHFRDAILHLEGIAFLVL